jgi:hypothetical protein
MTAVRFWTGVDDQPGKAAFAAATALLTFSTVQQGASTITNLCWNPSRACISMSEIPSTRCSHNTSIV